MKIFGINPIIGGNPAKDKNNEIRINLIFKFWLLFLNNWLIKLKFELFINKQIIILIKE